jgi:hypothetical protein
MTGQIPDQFKYAGEAYDLVGIDGEALYEPQDFGITTRAASTACWRGYQMFYNCKNGELVLEHMYVRSHDRPIVNGVSPKDSPESEQKFFFNTFYEDLNLKTKFTGSLLLAQDFISEMYVHMGFQSAEAFRTVIEISVSDGNITGVRDLSEEMDARRKRGRTPPTRPHTLDDSDIGDWVKDRFSLDYESE